MKYENYEKIIIERLTCPELDVQNREPNTSELNRQRQTTKPAVYVLYQGSSFAEPEELGMISQTETMTFDIIIFARKQRGEKGAYAAFEIITRRLLGYRTQGMRTPVTFLKFGYVSETNTTYQYALQCSFTSYIVQSCNEEETGQPPLIKQITNNITTTVQK
ncbi:MAG: Gp37 family protein [Dysgonamonadaceae bacterium]|jgi:hypothetical protein|nr:Gp37 family protein [Dysgonamonadaceae bacterium]